MTSKEMARLYELVLAAQAAVTRPWEPGETSRPVTFLTDHLAEEGWKLGWRLVAALREAHAELFRFYGEQDLHLAALDLVRDADDVPSIDDLARALSAKGADENASWIVEVPLANVSMDREWAPAGPTAAVRRAWDVDSPPDAERRRLGGTEDDARAEFAVFHHLHDRLGPPTRFLRSEEGTEDTTHTASLLTIEEGPRRLAVETAQARAHYVVATWSLLAPPEPTHLFPELAVWSPQPNQWEEPPHKRYEPKAWITRERRHAGIWHWAPYPLPDDSVLAAPFEAFAALERRSAQALLSGASALYAAERGSRAQLSEHILDVRRALECLCEPADGKSPDPRWENLASHFDVWTRVEEQRSYTPERVADLQDRLRNARNIGMHGADAVLIDLGWATGDRTLKYGRTARASDLAYTALYRDLGPMAFAVSEALRAAWKEMRAADFDDAAFEKLFSDPPRLDQASRA
jgi:hypothetical protein